MVDPMKMPQNYDKGQYRSDYYRFENTGVVYNGEWKVWSGLICRMKCRMGSGIIITPMRATMRGLLFRVSHMVSAGL